MKSKWIYGILVALLLVAFASTVHAAASEKSAKCLECHADSMPGIVDQWQSSTHWQAGVGCYECHAAVKGEADAKDRYNQKVE